jgi:gp16 family phage-associated protein
MRITEQQRKNAKQKLRAEGVNLSALCREQNVSYQAARDLLCGKLTGYRGEAHRAAILLGLKPDPSKTT